METTKITAKVDEKLLIEFNNKLESCFIKRDAFLNHVINIEIDCLEKEMKGLKQTSAARQYISGKLKKRRTKTINIVMNKKTVEKLNLIIKKSNMVRDAFINRIILFLSASDDVLKFLDLPQRLNEVPNNFAFDMDINTSILSGFKSMMDDPFLYLRHSIKLQFDIEIYRHVLPEQLHGMSCYLDNSCIPHTREYKEKVKEKSNFIASLSDEFEK